MAEVDVNHHWAFTTADFWTELLSFWKRYITDFGYTAPTVTVNSMSLHQEVILYQEKDMGSWVRGFECHHHWLHMRSWWEGVPSFMADPGWPHVIQSPPLGPEHSPDKDTIALLALVQTAKQGIYNIVTGIEPTIVTLPAYGPGECIKMLSWGCLVWCDGDYCLTDDTKIYAYNQDIASPPREFSSGATEPGRGTGTVMVSDSSGSAELVQAVKDIANLDLTYQVNDRGPVARLRSCAIKGNQ